MCDRQVILFARGVSAHIELVREGEALYVTRNGEPLPNARWSFAEVEPATDEFNRVMKFEGLA